MGCSLFPMLFQWKIKQCRMNMHSLKEELELRHAELPHSQVYFLIKPFNLNEEVWKYVVLEVKMVTQIDFCKGPNSSKVQCYYELGRRWKEITSRWHRVKESIESGLFPENHQPGVSVRIGFTKLHSLLRWDAEQEGSSHYLHNSFRNYKPGISHFRNRAILPFFITSSLWH